MKKVLFLILSIVPLTAFSSNKPCVDHFSETGSFFSGTTFKTWADFPSVSTAKAYKSVYLSTVKDGWKITQADKDMGIITATENVSYGKGKAAPLNLIVEKLPPKGSKVSITFSLSGGVVSPKKAVQKSFCKTLATVHN